MSDSVHSGRRGLHELALGGLLLGVLALHLPDLAKPFFADDYLFLEQVRGRNLVEAVTSPDPLGNFLRPVGRQAWFWVLGAIASEHAWVYRLASVVCFLVGVMLLHRIARRLLGAPSALVASTIFALHYAAGVPLLWISGAQDLLATTGALLALTCVLEGRGLLAALSLAVALLCKESVAMTPLVAVALVWAGGTTIGTALRRSVPVWLVAALWAAVWIASRDDRAAGQIDVGAALRDLPSAFVHLLQVAGGLEFRGSGSPGGHWGIVSVIVAIGAGALVWYTAARPHEESGGRDSPRTRPAMVAGLVWAIAGAVPVAVVASIWSAYFYLFALAGVSLLVAAVLANQSRRVTAGVVAVLALLSVNAARLDEFEIRPDSRSWQSHVNERYVRRSMETLVRSLAQIRRLHPTLPARSTVFFANLPVSAGVQTANGPVLRWAYRDTSLRSYFLGDFTKERATRGPVWFLVGGDSLSDHSRDPLLLPSFAYSMLVADRPDRACDALDLLLATSPGESEYRYWRAWTRHATGDTAGAAEDLDRLGLSPRFSAAAESLASPRVAFSDTAARLRSLLAARASAAWSPSVHARLAALYLPTPDSARNGTIEAFAYRVLRPEEPDAWRKWASAQLGEQKQEAALVSIERYLQLLTARGARDAEAEAVRTELRRLVTGDLAKESLRK